MKFWYWVAAAAISILLWVLVVGGFILIHQSAQSHEVLSSRLMRGDPEPFTTFNYVDSMSRAGRDEMCEVWSQDRLAVVQSLHVLGGASIEDAVAIASLACGV